MNEMMNENENALQTDTVEGFVWDHNLQSVNLTATSTYSNWLEKVVPVQIGILFGKEASHFKRYFCALFNTMMTFKTFEEFINSHDGFPGMVADFSDGQEKGFEEGLEMHSKINASDYRIEELYRFCLHCSSQNGLSQELVAAMPPSGHCRLVVMDVMFVPLC